MDKKKINLVFNIFLILVFVCIAIWLSFVEGIDIMIVLAGLFVILVLAFSSSFLPFRMSHKIIQTHLLEKQKNITNKKIQEIKNNTPNNFGSN